MNWTSYARYDRSGHGDGRSRNWRSRWSRALRPSRRAYGNIWYKRGRRKRFTFRRH